MLLYEQDTRDDKEIIVWKEYTAINPYCVLNALEITAVILFVNVCQTLPDEMDRRDGEVEVACDNQMPSLNPC